MEADIKEKVGSSALSEEQRAKWLAIAEDTKQTFLRRLEGHKEIRPDKGPGARYVPPSEEEIRAQAAAEVRAYGPSEEMTAARAAHQKAIEDEAAAMKKEQEAQARHKSIIEEGTKRSESMMKSEIRAKQASERVVQHRKEETSRIEALQKEADRTAAVVAQAKFNEVKTHTALQEARERSKQATDRAQMVRGALQDVHTSARTVGLKTSVEGAQQQVENVRSRLEAEGKDEKTKQARALRRELREAKKRARDAQSRLVSGVGAQLAKKGIGEWWKGADKEAEEAQKRVTVLEAGLAKSRQTVAASEPAAAAAAAALEKALKERGTSDVTRTLEGEYKQAREEASAARAEVSAFRDRAKKASQEEEAAGVAVAAARTAKIRSAEVVEEARLNDETRDQIRLEKRIAELRQESIQAQEKDRARREAYRIQRAQDEERNAEKLIQLSRDVTDAKFHTKEVLKEEARLAREALRTERQRASVERERAKRHTQLTRIRTRTGDLAARVRASELPGDRQKEILDDIRKLRQRAAGQFRAAGRDPLNWSQAARTDAAVTRLTRTFNRYRREARGVVSSTSELGRMLRNMESASVLAIGPLSAIGARIRALGAITTRATATLALGFGTVIGTLAAFIISARRAVTAGLEFERIAGALTVVTKQADLTNLLFERLSKTALTFGTNIETSTFQFSKLSAAAKNSAVGLKTLEDVYHGVAGAIATFRIESVAQEKIFRALTQMLSKGTAQAEEVRNQFSEHLPGAFSLLAKSIGLTTDEFSRRLERGLVAAEDVIKGIGKTFSEEFTESGKQATRTLGNQLNMMRNNWFMFGLALDKTIGASTRARNVIETVNVQLVRMKENTETLIDVAAYAFGAVGAAVGFGAMRFGRAVYRYGREEGKPLKRTSGAFRTAFREAEGSKITKMFKALAPALLAFTSGIWGLVTILGVAAAAIAAYFASKYFATSTRADKLDEETVEIVNKIAKVDFKEAGVDATDRQNQALEELKSVIRSTEAEQLAVKDLQARVDDYPKQLRESLERPYEDPMALISSMSQTDRYRFKNLLGEQDGDWRSFTRAFLKLIKDTRSSAAEANIGLGKGFDKNLEDRARVLQKNLDALNQLLVNSVDEMTNTFWRLNQELDKIYKDLIAHEFKISDIRSGGDLASRLINEFNVPSNMQQSFAKGVDEIIGSMHETRIADDVHKMISRTLRDEEGASPKFEVFVEEGLKSGRFQNRQNLLNQLWAGRNIELSRKIAHNTARMLDLIKVGGSANLGEAASIAQQSLGLKEQLEESRNTGAPTLIEVLRDYKRFAGVLEELGYSAEGLKEIVASYVARQLLEREGEEKQVRQQRDADRTRPGFNTEIGTSMLRSGYMANPRTSIAEAEIQQAQLDYIVWAGEEAKRLEEAYGTIEGGMRFGKILKDRQEKGIAKLALSWKKLWEGLAKEMEDAKMLFWRPWEIVDAKIARRVEEFRKRREKEIRKEYASAGLGAGYNAMLTATEEAKQEAARLEAEAHRIRVEERNARTRETQYLHDDHMRFGGRALGATRTADSAMRDQEAARVAFDKKYLEEFRRLSSEGSEIDPKERNRRIDEMKLLDKKQALANAAIMTRELSKATTRMQEDTAIGNLLPWRQGDASIDLNMSRRLEEELDGIRLALATGNVAEGSKEWQKALEDHARAFTDQWNQEKESAKWARIQGNWPRANVEGVGDTLGSNLGQISKTEMFNIQGFKAIRDSFNTFFENVILEMQTAILKATITNPLSQIIQGFVDSIVQQFYTTMDPNNARNIGVMAQKDWSSKIGSWVGRLFGGGGGATMEYWGGEGSIGHGGGIIGHGLRSNERMIKAEVGEGIFTKAQMQRLAPIGGGGGGGAGGAGGIKVSINNYLGDTAEVDVEETDDGFEINVHKMLDDAMSQTIGKGGNVQQAILGLTGANRPVLSR